jgi:hypothetical protein
MSYQTARKKLLAVTGVMNWAGVMVKIKYEKVVDLKRGK